VVAVVLSALMLLLRFNVVSYFVLWLASSAIPTIGSAWSHPGLHAYAVQAAVLSALLVIGLLIWCQRELSR